MEKSKKIVLFDIDYTLFDTDEYRRILYPRLAEKLGIDQEQLRKFRKEFEPEMKQQFGHFNPEFFLQKIAMLSQNQISVEELENIFWDKAIYSNVLGIKSKKLFEYLTQHDILIGLLSTGDKRHQLAKIEILLTFLPEKYHHIFSNKLDSLKDILEIYTEFRVYIVDDLPVVLAKAKRISPEVTTILKRTQKTFEITEEVEAFKPDFEINDISEVKDIVIK